LRQCVARSGSRHEIDPAGGRSDPASREQRKRPRRKVGAPSMRPERIRTSDTTTRSPTAPGGPARDPVGLLWAVCVVLAWSEGSMANDGGILRIQR
jgi:hypothetical protein